ncbi:MAG: FHA domain-containing protein [Ardenticatenaceae bacterium]|nr:FHA domain-containing protein [Ardenticatenaceae bacterium]
MTKKNMGYLLLLVGWLCFLKPFAVQAQTSGFLTINHVVATEGDDNMGLDVFFTVTDSNGRPMPQPDIEAASIQLLGGNGTPVPVQIADPQTPIFIALLLDTSGSMQDVMEQVRVAAKSAIDNAPPTAHFAVIPFNESSFPLQDFTDNHIRVKDVIDTVQAIPNRGTCLYDAVYGAIERLDQQIKNPQERRAIILFTDGQDQLTVDSSEPCSTHTYEEVITAAKPSANVSTITPIHTIGIYNQSEAELNVGELRNMAAETAAFSAIGNQTNLNSLFQEIIAGLNSQLMARGQVFPQQGENQAVLSIKLRGDDSPLTTTFSFFSSKNYDLPPPPVDTLISNFQYNATTNVYTLSLSVASAETVHQLIVNVWDVRGGTQVSNDQIFENPDATLLVEINGNNLQAGREYSIHVQAINQDGFLIQDADGETLLTEREFTHDPPLSVDFTIQAVTPDYENGLFYIDLDVPEAGRVQTYEGFIVDDNTGSKIYEFGPTLFTGMRLQEQMPDTLKSAETPGTYRVTVYLYTADQQRSESTYDDFKPVPPPPPSWFSVAIAALTSNPLYLGIIALIVLSLGGVLFFGSKKRKQEEPVIVRPPVDKSIVWSDFDRSKLMPQQNVAPDEEEFLNPQPAAAAVVSPATKRLKIKVIQAGGGQAERIVGNFPCVIGREGVDFNVSGDPRISRKHVTISLRDNQFYVTDLGSVNGTILGNNKLPANTPTPLGSNRIIKLTSQTQLEVEVLE